MSAPPSRMLCKLQRSHCHCARRLCSPLVESSSPHSKKRRSKLCVFLPFFFPPPPLITPSSPSALAIFGQQLCLASRQKKEVPFQKGATRMMVRLFFLNANMIPFFTSKEKGNNTKTNLLYNLCHDQHH